MNTGDYQNKIESLPDLSKYKFENIFKIHQTSEDVYYYNILKTVNIPRDIDPGLYYLTRPDSYIPLTTLSHLHYDTIDLWWLICIVNNINNPIQFISPSRVIKIVKPEHVERIISSIKTEITS